MRYWVYISDKVEGPFDEDKLVTLQGFTPDTLICSEDTANSGNQEWVKASSIFEFEQPAPAPQPIPEKQPALQPASTAAQDGLAALLLSKLDALTSQISNLQTQLDGMQTKLDDAITAQKEAQSSKTMTPSLPPMDDSHANTITLTRHDVEAQVEEVLPPSEQEKPLDMLGPVDLGDQNTEGFSAKTGEDVIVSAALDSLYNAKLQEQQDINENTFQDLLTPHQAATLAATADQALSATEEQEKTLDEALKQVEEKANDPEEKDKLIDSFSTIPQQNVVDQLIEEKEEEKKEEENSGIGLAAAGIAGAAALAATAAMASTSDKEQPNEEITPEPEKQPIDLSPEAIGDMPSLNITQEEQPEPQEPQTPAEPVLENQATATPKDFDIPSLDTADQPFTAESADESTNSSLEELVPGADVQPNDGIIITEQDLKEAFAEHKVEDQSVEQMFGLAGKPSEAAAQTDDTNKEAPVMDTLEEKEETAQAANEKNTHAEPATVSLAPANPNELTEIELKEGSTYLISDFVPPATTDSDALPKELAGLEAEKPTDNDTSATPQEDPETEVQEMVSLKTQTEKTVEKPNNAPDDVTISQVILENTIRTKRGASLDIKTVPMVPEPGESQRLHLDGMDDDLNTQHDVQEADVKPASKSTKVVLFALVGILLLAIIYFALAFLHILPAQFNLFADKQADKQAAQIEAMLTPEEPAPVTELDMTQQTETDSMDEILDEVKAYGLPNGYTLKDFIDAKHADMAEMITWEIATAVDPDNYSILVKVPPENPQSFKISYRFNYNAVTKELEPTISDAKNLLDSATTGETLPVTQVAIQ